MEGEEEDGGVVRTRLAERVSRTGVDGAELLSYPGRPLKRRLEAIVRVGRAEGEGGVEKIRAYLNGRNEVGFETVDKEDVDEVTSLLISNIENESFLDEMSMEKKLILLGLRRTKQSFTAILPSISQLWAAFNHVHTADSASPLTVGARALSKHCHRNSENYWQIEFKGSEQHKNEIANDKLLSMLSDVHWMNYHLLPGHKRVFEIRNRDGYGIRYDVSFAGDEELEEKEKSTAGDDNSILESDRTRVLPAPTSVVFRGFLEPHMAEGWLTGWKH